MAEDVVLTAREQILARLQTLKILVDADIPYRLESVFAETSGWGGNGEVIRRAKLLRNVGPQLTEMLLPNEEVLYVAKGVQHSFVEQYFMGALWALWTHFLNQTVFVLTNLRLLMMRSNGSGKPKENFWVIYYSEIDTFEPSWTGVLDLTLQDRKKLTFTGFSRRDRKAMPVIFQEAVDAYQRLGFEPGVSQSRENLCAHCFKIVPVREFACRGCGADYWTPGQLALRSLIFPSWGDFCMKHYGRATFELIGYCISWIAAINALAGPNTEAGIIFAVFIFIIEHPLDAFLTYNVAKKGLNPRRGPDPDRVVEEEVVDDVEEVT